MPFRVIESRRSPTVSYSRAPDRARYRGRVVLYRRFHGPHAQPT